MCRAHRHLPQLKDITMFVNLMGHSWFTSADRKQDLYNTDQYCPKTFAIEGARLRHFSLSVYHDTNVFCLFCLGSDESVSKRKQISFVVERHVVHDLSQQTCQLTGQFISYLSGISVFSFQACLLSTGQPHWQCSERVLTDLCK
jgi:hypothetical protein